MVEWKYSDYITVKEDFIPVYTEDSDRIHKKAWKSFIPHKQMEELLEILFSALDRSDPKKKKSIWVVGPYGTGKTFTSLAIKHFFEDEEREVKDYFESHASIRRFWNRLESLRKKDFLFIYRSGSSFIRNDKRLLMEIQQKVLSEAKLRGYTITTNTIMNEILEKFRDKDSLFRWDKFFQKYLHLFPSASKPEDLVKALEEGNLEIAEKVLEALEDEGYIINDKPEIVKDWLKEIIEVNKLGGIVFIWDEFTDYFYNNASYSSLQELAHLTFEAPFYLFLITHRVPTQIRISEDDSSRKLIDRFHQIKLEMEEVTAYELLGNAIRVKPGKGEEWLEKQYILRNRVNKILKNDSIFNFSENINQNTLLKLVPIHPFSAYLLAYISRLYSSSQRSLFQFLTDDHRGFNGFIRGFPKDNHTWLTPDFLWDYFFEGQIDLKDLGEFYRKVLFCYRNNIDALSNDDAKRIFKTILLFLILDYSNAGKVETLKPTVENLELAFLGENIKLEESVKEILEKNILFLSSAKRPQEFILPSTDISDGKLQEYIEFVKQNYSFERVLDFLYKEEINEVISLNDYEETRLRFEIISAKDLKERKDLLLAQKRIEPYKLGIALVLGVNEDILIEAQMIGKEIADRIRESNWILVYSCKPLGSDRWNSWIENYARFMYYRKETDDHNLRDYHEKESLNIFKDWLEEVRIEDFVLIYGEEQSMRLKGLSAVKEALNKKCKEIFLYGPERITKKNTLYSLKGSTAGVIKVALELESPNFQTKDIVDQLKELGLFSAELPGKRNHPDHPVVKLREKIENEWKNNKGRLDLYNLWLDLQQPPFGLMPNPIGAFLYALTMKGFSNGYYLVDSNSNSQVLDLYNLHKAINNVVRGKAGEFDYQICKLSEAAEKFCKLCSEIFDLSEAESLTPEEVRKNLRERFDKYPLWAITYNFEDNQDDVRDAVEMLQEFLKYDDDNSSKLNDEFYKDIWWKLKKVKDEIKNGSGKTFLEKGFETYLKLKNPQINALKKELGIQTDDIRRDLRELLNEDAYLWEEANVNEKLPILLNRLEFMSVIKQFTNEKANTLADAIEKFKEEFRKYKLPVWLYKEFYSQFAEEFEILSRIITNPDDAVKQLQIDSLKQNAARIAGILRDPAGLIKQLVIKWFGQNISNEDAAYIIRNIDNLFDISENEVQRLRNNLQDALSGREKIGLTNDIKGKWRSLTNTDSPREWSNKRRVPIVWVLNENEFIEFIRKFENMDDLDKHELKDLRDFMISREEAFNILNNSKEILKIFAKNIARDFGSLLTDEDIKELQDYISEKIGKDVNEWPVKLIRIQEVVIEKLADQFKEKFLPKLQQYLKKSSPEQIKEIFLKLSEKNVKFGLVLLSLLTQKGYLDG